MINARHIEYAISGIAVLAFLGAIAYIAAAVLAGCGGEDPYVRPAAYGAELTACNQTATTLCESVYCEQQVRMRYSRPLRTWPAECQDGGSK